MAGDLFVIQCTTCSSRLRVREAAVIGQILACPKCGSMVLVEPPPGFKLEGGAAPATVEVMSVSPAAAAKRTAPSLTRETVSDSDFADVSALFDSPSNPGAPATENKPSTKRAAAASAPTSPVSSNPAAPTIKPVGTSADIKNASPVAETSEFLRSTPKPASSPNFASKSGIHKATTPKLPVAQALATPQAATPQIAPPPPAEMTANPSSVKAPAQASPAGTAIPEANVPSDSPCALPNLVPPHVQRMRIAALLVVSCSMGIALVIGVAYFAAERRAAWAKTREQTAQLKEPEKVTEPDSPPAEKSPEPMPPEPEAPPEKTPPEEAKLPEQPIEPQPEKEPIKPVEPKQPVIDLVDDPSEEKKTPVNDPFKLDELRKLDRMLNPGAEPQSVAALPGPSPSTPTPPVPSPPVIEPTPSLPRPEMRKIDVAARLADKFPKFATEGTPLVDFLQGVSNLSTVPISLDPAALAWSRIKPDHTIKTNLANVTVREILVQSLASYRLEPQVVGNTVLITRSSTSKKIEYPIGDLTKGEAAANAALKEFVQALAAPETWTTAGGTGTCVPQGEKLIVDTNELAHTQVMEVLERLRVARGATPRSKLPPELFVLERRTQRAAASLGKVLSLNFSAPTPLVKILKRLGSETGTQLLIDWQALAETGWPTDTEASVTFEKQSLDQCLRKLLEPMDLTYRVIDAHTIQVTSFVALAKLRELEIFPASLLQGADEDESKLIERLQSQLGGDVVLRYDAPSRSLFVLATQPQQEALARLQRPAEKE